MKKILRIFGLVFLLLTFSFSYASEKIIVIDVSHGGKDTGNVTNGFKEKDLTLEIALKILALNKDEKINIILTRDADDFVSLEQRVGFINSLNPDYVISLHINASDNVEVNGFDFFVSPEGAQTQESNFLVKTLENAIAAEFSSNGIKEANFNLLKNVQSPITVIEMGYISNVKDRDILTSEVGQQKIAQAIYNTIK